MEEGGEEEVEEVRIDDGGATRLRNNSKILADGTLHEAKPRVISVDNDDDDDDDVVELGTKTKVKEDRSERVARRELLGDNIVAGCSRMLQREDCFNRMNHATIC